MATEWIKDNCPECKAINWICTGTCGNTDPTTLDVDGYKCHACGDTILFHEELTREFEGVSDDISTEELIKNYCNTVDGLEHPN